MQAHVGSGFESGSRGLSRCFSIRGRTSAQANTPMPPQEDQLRAYVNPEVNSESHVLGCNTLPPQVTREEERSFLEEEKCRLKTEMRQAEAFTESLNIVCRYDAQRMEKELDYIAARIVYEEIQLAHKGLNATLLDEHVAKKKVKAVQDLTPGRCYACRGSGHENDKMIRTCESICLLGNRQHWHHQSCLRAIFLTAMRDEEEDATNLLLRDSHS